MSSSTFLSETGFSIIYFFLALCFGVFTLRSKLCVPNLLGYITKKTYFSWSTHCKKGILQEGRKTSWWDEKKQSEGCLTKLKNMREAVLGIFRNTYWSPKQLCLEIYNAFSRTFLAA